MMMYSYNEIIAVAYAYRDRQPIPNFELWAELFCVLPCFHNKDSKFVSVRTPRNHPSFVNTSPAVVNDTLMEIFLNYYSMKTPKFDFLFKNFYIEFRLAFDLYWTANKCPYMIIWTQTAVDCQYLYLVCFHSDIVTADSKHFRASGTYSY